MDITGGNKTLRVKANPLQTIAAQPHAGLGSVPLQVLADLFDHAPDLAFFVKDAAGCYVAVNDSLVKRHGFRFKSQVLGRRPCDNCAGDFGRVPTEQDAALLRTGLPLIDHLEQQWYLPHRPVWCLTTKLPLRDAAGNIIGLIGISRDVRAPVNPNEIPAGLATALQFFEHNLAEPLSPSSLARRADLTPTRLARLIRRFFGLTPSQYITQARLAAAARLLQDTQLGVSDIAYQCGFYDHSAFSRAFHSAMGITPSEYRRAKPPANNL